MQYYVQEIYILITQLTIHHYFEYLKFKFDCFQGGLSLQIQGSLLNLPNSIFQHHCRSYQSALSRKTSTLMLRYHRFLSIFKKVKLNFKLLTIFSLIFFSSSILIA